MSEDRPAVKIIWQKKNRTACTNLQYNFQVENGVLWDRTWDVAVKKKGCQVQVMAGLQLNTRYWASPKRSKRWEILSTLCRQARWLDGNAVCVFWGTPFEFRAEHRLS
jgi:hypothetical protein